MKTLILSILVLTMVYISDAQNVNMPEANVNNLEFKYEYAVKFVCGEQKSSRNLRLSRGLYTTTVNIHNPNDTLAIFYKKLALTYPPEEQQAGEIIPLGLDSLDYDQALKTDYYNIKEQFSFSNYIEGFVIIQSIVSLDVSAVYTSAKPTKFIFRPSYKVASIDIEYIREREKTIHSTPPQPSEPDHFLIYLIDSIPVNKTVNLQGQFDNQPKEANIHFLKYFANPTSKEHDGFKTGINDPNRHFNLYRITEEAEPDRTIIFQNQFGKHNLVIDEARLLMVPAQKTSDTGNMFPESLDHYKCYEVTDTFAIPVPPSVSLADQFGSEHNVKVKDPECFCLPVNKTMSDGSSYEIVNPDEYFVLYNLIPKLKEREISVVDQFLEDSLEVDTCVMLAVPSKELEVISVGN